MLQQKVTHPKAYGQQQKSQCSVDREKDMDLSWGMTIIKIHYMKFSED